VLYNAHHYVAQLLHVLTKDHTVLPAIQTCNPQVESDILALTSKPHSVTVIRSVLVSVSYHTKCKRSSWSGWLLTYRDDNDISDNGQPFGWTQGDITSLTYTTPTFPSTTNRQFSNFKKLKRFRVSCCKLCKVDEAGTHRSAKTHAHRRFCDS